MRGSAIGCGGSRETSTGHLVIIEARGEVKDDSL